MQTSSSPLDQALALLKAGELVGIPTETVYGLAADASQPDAVAKIFAMKGRPADHPVIVHIAGRDQLSDWAQNIPDAAWKLADAFWPGSLTLILQRKAHVPDAVTGGQDTVGLRAPAHPLTHELLQRFGGGLAAPSANQFGHVSPTTAQHVFNEFGEKLGLILDGGPCQVGVESTIVGLTSEHPTLLRPGGVPAEAIEAVLGVKLIHHEKPSTANLRVSGLLDSHYAPRTPLLVGPLGALENEATRRLETGERIALLHRSHMLKAVHGVTAHAMPMMAEPYARDLYATLRQFDNGQFDVLLLETPPQEANWLAVNDRVKRAASGWLG
ncbi:L-threonylcarbamoyladenylate synthase [Chitinimonas sp. BJB300]|uniref:L-threonylcarbamoyladenylate synthase n=1 Tax=Chitinimonas sp. BJB300 TaxID=1559339 RepID=UPI000C0F3363|nr:L-threonylcarbamoyladenylate synthase [Chitinimonas sp. BJB300]PHV13018.1 threonylcarbamoyl-AMP synthase [Chitinimonas sp. BJB300]TSJ88924.1 threonylcarbamoyl-AMP synthase [Chitinimonas sp. BJB300]